MRQYHVKLHFHKQKGNYFAYDMWQWQDQVEGKSVSFSKLDYFGVEGNLVYESEDTLNRGHVLVKEGDWLTKTRDFEIELLPEGHVREVCAHATLKPSGFWVCVGLGAPVIVGKRVNRR